MEGGEYGRERSEVSPTCSGDRSALAVTALASLYTQRDEVRTSLSRLRLATFRWSALIKLRPRLLCSYEQNSGGTIGTGNRTFTGDLATAFQCPHEHCQLVSLSSHWAITPDRLLRVRGPYLVVPPSSGVSSQSESGDRTCRLVCLFRQIVGKAWTSHALILVDHSNPRSTPSSWPEEWPVADFSCCPLRAKGDGLWTFTPAFSYRWFRNARTPHSHASASRTIFSTRGSATVLSQVWQFHRLTDLLELSHGAREPRSSHTFVRGFEPRTSASATLSH